MRRLRPGSSLLSRLLLQRGLLPLCLLSLCLLTAAPARVLAEGDEEEKPAASPGGKAAPGADDKGNYDKISDDWKKNVKRKSSAQHAKERALYWEGKGAKDKDLFWLALMWDKAGDHGKAIAAFEGYLKVPETQEANRETCFFKIMENHAKAEAWDKAVEAGELLVKTYPGSKNIGQAYGELGRHYRRKGDLDKALSAWGQAADAKYSHAILDLADVHMVNGDIDKAKATLTKGLEVVSKDAIKETIGEVLSFVNRIGTPAPAPADVVCVSGQDAPTAWGPKPTLLYFTPIVMPYLEARLREYAGLKRGWGEGVDIYAVMTYMQYDPFTKKAVPDLAEADEAAKLTEVLLKENGGSTVLLFKKDLFASLEQRTQSQKTLLDAEGKFRWVRVTHQSDYDWFVTEQALKKVTGS